MKRDNKIKDARRRARKLQRKAIHACGNAITAVRVIPSKKQSVNKYTIHDYLRDMEDFDD